MIEVSPREPRLDVGGARLGIYTSALHSGQIDDYAAITNGVSGDIVAPACDELPPKRVVVRFDLRDRPKERYWLVLDRQDVELCVKPPDLDEDLVVTTDSETLMRVHMGRLSFQEAMHQNRWTIEGTPQLVRGFPRWGGLSYYAGVPPARAAS